MLVLGLMLALAAGLGLAQEPGRQGNDGIQAAPVSTAFTYQGRLTDGGNPANGSYDFEFKLYDAASGGGQVGSTVSKGDVAVSDGLFAVELDFGSNRFTGDARWLEISARPGDSTGAYTDLTPRQALTAAPYALYALSAPWSGLTGVPPDFGDGVDNDTTYSAGTGLSLVGTTFSADTSYLQRRVSGTCASGNAIRVINTDGTVTCESVDGGGAHDHWGESWSGSGIGLTLNSSNEDALRVSGGDDGIQIESANDDGVFVKSAGQDGMFMESTGRDGVLIESAGRDGFSVVNASGDGLYVSQAGDDGVDVRTAGDNGVYIESAGNNGVHVDSASKYGVSVGSTTSHGVSVYSPGDDGLSVRFPGNDGVAVYWAGNDGVHVGHATRYGVYTETDATYGFYTPNKIYAGDGYVDIAEHIDAAGDVEPGDVVVVDPDHDERVVKSTRPYDASVAGIISTDPAMLIGKSDTETPLALAGRAPCKVSAENGAIHRGDLLTTSSTPGHAMKATDPRLGTILGKALGELESGTNVIPVLVILQ